jgi:hypothetical protein
MALRGTDLCGIQGMYEGVCRVYLNNSESKNYFLAVCCHLDSTIDMDFINDTCPHGGKIGIGNSVLDTLFGGSKLLRLHAVLHDGCGYMKTHRSSGPGYCYAIYSVVNSCLLGHISGLSYCLYLKWFNRKIYGAFEL